jgi:lysophospholipid acyltransferase (LPLAT)-like uncharacterized protein
MKIRNRLLIRFLAAIAAAVLWCWLRTLRRWQFGSDGLSHPIDPTEKQFLYLFWHESIFGTLYEPGKLKVLISQHADGEWIARVCNWLGLDVVRGSTTRGGRRAVQALMRSVGNTANLAITPDGPRGPRRKMQPGAVWIASTTGIPIVLAGIGYSRAWRMNSWDQFGLPVPGSGITQVCSQPIYVPADLDRDGLERWREHLERELTGLNEVAEAWAVRIRQHGARATPPETTFVPLPKPGSSTPLAA